MSRRRGDAVVLGAGISGLAAAAALSRTCRQVTVIERDPLPATPAGRRGVPQSTQLHNVLGRGLLHLDELFDGFRDRVAASGGTLSGVGEQTQIYDIGHRLPRRDVGLQVLSAGRPLLEHVGREAVQAFGNVRLIDGTRAVGLVRLPGGAVRGVRLADAAVPGSDPFVLDADLVVDATGISAVGAGWLDEAVPEERHTFNRWYASTPFERRRGEGFWMVFPTYPGTRSGLVSPSGRDEWHVSVSGCETDDPPDGSSEVKAYAAMLEDPWIADLLDGCDAVGPTHLFRRPTGVRRRYDLLAAPVAGFAAVGDAATLLNPLLGLGFSSAAWQASRLGVLAAEAGSLADADFSAAYAAEAQAIGAQAWGLSVLDHHPLVSAVADRARVDLAAARSAVARTLHEDGEVHRMDSEMWHLLRPHQALVTDDVVRNVCARLHPQDPLEGR